MADGATIFLDDIQLQKMLLGLPDKTLNKIIRPAINKATTIIRLKAREVVPVDSGLLK